MKLGLAQIFIQWENKELNKLHVKKCVEEFSKAVSEYNETALLLFPEMSLTGFSMNTENTADLDKETVEYCEELSEEYGVAIGIGWVKKKEKLCENHYSIVTPTKGEVSDYIKIHPFSYSEENKFFKGGNKISICELDNLKIGTAICYDLRFPEIFQVMSKDADLIIVPANWPKKRRTHWNTLLAARAIENQCFLAGINCCGLIGGIEYSGDSALYSPMGDSVEYIDVIEDADLNNKIFIYNISNSVSEIRKSFPVKQDRREDLYIELIKENKECL